MMQFPVTDLLDEQECYNWLLKVLHPHGLCCANGHLLGSGQKPHNCERAPILDYRCRQCGNVFHIFTGTIWSGTHYNCKLVVLLMRGFIQGKSTLHLSKELELDYGTVLKWRKRVQELAFDHKPTEKLEDEEVESDEMFQNAGEKGELHADPDDPPRRRANKRRGLGTMENDRPPILGNVGRQSKQIRLTVCENTQKATIQPKVRKHTQSTSTLYTDESTAYGGIADTERNHSTVCHSKKEWARDDDGDGIREVHCNTQEGIWTGLRNFLRPFRGVHKKT